MTATLTDIRNAMATTLKNSINIRINTYAVVEDVGDLPAIVIEPYTANFEGAFQKGWDTWDFNLYVLVSRADAVSAQKLLDQLLSGHGENSIREVLHGCPDLGLSDPVDTTVYEMKGYGGAFTWYGVPHIGAILRARVRIQST